MNIKLLYFLRTTLDYVLKWYLLFSVNLFARAEKLYGKMCAKPGFSSQMEFQEEVTYLCKCTPMQSFHNMAYTLFTSVKAIVSYFFFKVIRTIALSWLLTVVKLLATVCKQIKQENLGSIHKHIYTSIYMYIDVHTRLYCKQVLNEDHLQFNINLPTSVVSSTDWSTALTLSFQWQLFNTFIWNIHKDGNHFLGYSAEFLFFIVVALSYILYNINSTFLQPAVTLLYL